MPEHSHGIQDIPAQLPSGLRADACTRSAAARVNAAGLMIVHDRRIVRLLGCRCLQMCSFFLFLLTSSTERESLAPEQAVELQAHGALREPAAAAREVVGLGIVLRLLGHMSARCR